MLQFRNTERYKVNEVITEVWRWLLPGLFCTIIKLHKSNSLRHMFNICGELPHTVKSKEDLHIWTSFNEVHIHFWQHERVQALTWRDVSLAVVSACELTEPQWTCSYSAQCTLLPPLPGKPPHPGSWSQIKWCRWCWWRRGHSWGEV